MKHKLYVIYDSKAKFYKGPMLSSNKGTFIRQFTEAVNDPKSGELYKYPEDFAAYEVGEFDDENGTLQPYQTHDPIGKAIEFKTLNHQELTQ